MKPLSDRPEWKSVLDAIEASYGVPKGGSPAPDARIPSTSESELVPDSSELSESEALNRFSEFHADMLLIEGNGLLQRAAQTREVYRRLKIDTFNVAMETYELKRLHEIFSEELANGVIGLGLMRLAPEVFAAETMKETLEAVRSQTHSAYDDFFAHAQERAAVVGEIATALGQKADLAKKLDEINASYEERAWAIEMFAAESAVKSNSARLDGLKNVQVVAHKVPEFEERRAEAALEVLLVRSERLVEEGGVLNYLERSEAARIQFQGDYIEAYLRLIAAGRGLQTLYGYAEALPVVSGPSSFDEILAWASRAASFLSETIYRDQIDIYSFSIPAEAFKMGTAKTEVALEAGQSNVRLRGVTIIVEDLSSAPYRLEIIPPSKALYRRKKPDGTVEEPDELLQPAPTVWVGRARSPSLLGPPDVYGSACLHNLSPFGEWSVSLKGITDSELTKRGFKGIEMQVFIVAQV
ncbi:hypothetical protein [Rhizobium phaseoli]|uniref:Tc toxin complex TcA C-terminal TcB-binding domain-containing protein n=1 Tax=Rhizobium phaseoli TaxID=396 RepID=A0ABM6CFK1_9HYPH|nr:hypothetical protein [Rhizobium phaseoli]ANL87038.1 hypothetical protein AMC81_PA00014 [Rhizobium phaseoli]ANL93547.1 hypothetical protein AMC80_PA00014 [Rhizobium phaseoli]